MAKSSSGSSKQRKKTKVLRFDQGITSDSDSWDSDATSTSSRVLCGQLRGREKQDSSNFHDKELPESREQSANEEDCDESNEGGENDARDASSDARCVGSKFPLCSGGSSKNESKKRKSSADHGGAGHEERLQLELKTPNWRPRDGKGHFLPLACAGPVDATCASSSKVSSAAASVPSSPGCLRPSANSSKKLNGARLEFASASSSSSRAASAPFDLIADDMKKKMEELVAFANSCVKDADSSVKALESELDRTKAELEKVRAGEAKAKADLEKARASEVKLRQENANQRKECVSVAANLREAQDKARAVQVKLDEQTKRAEKFTVDVVDGIAKVADILSCPMTGTIFSEGNPAAFVQSDGSHYGKHVERRDGTCRWQLIEAAQPVRTDLQRMVSIRACNRSITNTDATGCDSVLPNAYMRFFKHPISAQYIRVDPSTVRVFHTPTDAGEALVNLIKRIDTSAPVRVAGVDNLMDMIAEPVKLKMDGNALESVSDVRRALRMDAKSLEGASEGKGAPPSKIAEPSMELVEEWKKSFTTPITTPNYLPKVGWGDDVGRTELESTDAFIFRAHNRELRELTKNGIEDPYAPLAPMRPPNNHASGEIDSEREDNTEQDNVGNQMSDVPRIIVDD